MIVKIYDNNISSDLIDEIKKFDGEGISNYLNDPFTFTTGIVTASFKEKEENQIVAIGILRVVNELKITIRPEISNINKAMAITLLLKEVNKNMQCNEAIALITAGGDHYINILKDHFKFREESGVMLRLEREV